ncbi:MAG TPA: SDR family oxidoreductase [Duganella sp.]|uniref:SDR family oxidoreductase n=1 Tax=Duganella sp. TaxID=1904440 RepID=UPI002ED0C23F
MSAPRTALVTGGTRGIGRAIVERLLAAGWRVHATYRHDAAAARALLAGAGPGLSVHQIDGADAEAVAGFVQGLDADDPIGLLVNNAGQSLDQFAHQAAPAAVAALFDANVLAAMHYCRALLPAMQRRRGGDIVNISSLASVNVRHGNAFYGASKAALERFGAGLALEAIRFGIAVNTVAPGYVETELIANMLTPEKKRALLASIPARRLTAAGEIADAVEFLASRRPLLVGVVLPLGGGGHL